jgi:hypothetical protein
MAVRLAFWFSLSDQSSRVPRLQERPRGRNVLDYIEIASPLNTVLVRAWQSVVGIERRMAGRSSGNGISAQVSVSPKRSPAPPAVEDLPAWKLKSP